MQDLAPGEEPDGPAVVPLAGLRATRDGHRVAGHGELVVGLRVLGREVHAAVADVDVALLAHRPGGVVHVVAAPGEAHRPRHLEVVARTFHVGRVLLLDRQVGAVRRVLAGPPGADRPGGPQVPVLVDAVSYTHLT